MKMQEYSVFLSLWNDFEQKQHGGGKVPVVRNTGD
jgi:hypothetical protein